MRPLKIRLAGFAGIASGRAKEVVEIDFGAVDADAQIVALAGPNGAGKTTIMDNLHPYRVMPSRASSPTPGAFSFYDHLVNGDSGKDLDWEHEGIRYRSVLKFKTTAKTRKQEAFLFVLDGAQAVPWQDKATGLISDGKTDTYDRAIEAILGKPEVFFTAQFSAQGKQPIGKMTAGEVKTLLGQMLGMDKTAALGAKSQALVKELRPHLNIAHDTVARLQTQVGTEDAGHTIASLQANAQSTAQGRQALRKQRDEAIAAWGVAKREFQMQEQNRAARAALHKQIEDARAASVAKRSEIQQRHESESRKLREQLAQSNRAVQVAAGVEQDLVRRIADQELLASQAGQLAAAEGQWQALTARREPLQQSMAARQPAIDKLGGIRAAIAELQQELARTQSSGEHIAVALEKVKATAALLGEVPCQGSAMARQCKLLAQANRAAAEMQSVSVKLEDVRRAWKEGRASVKSKTAELDALLAQEAHAKKEGEELAGLERSIAQLTAQIAKKQYVDAAILELPALREKLRQAQAELASARGHVAPLQARLDTLAQSQAADLRAFDDAAAQEGKRLREQLDNLPQVLGQGDLQAAEDRVKDIDALDAQAKASEDRLAQAIRDEASKAERIAQARQDLNRAQAAVNAISAEIAWWTLLGKALGTDGIIAMEIDDAGPAIALLANQLLQDCYGGRFQISLQTQAKTAAGIRKEAFLIQVEDTHRGESKLLDAMSGGEKVWINECLVRAIALYMAQSADTKFETLFSDESDGSLDPERKRQFMQMKRAVLERGGYSQEYLITQTPQLLDMCDAVIDVGAI